MPVRVERSDNPTVRCPVVVASLQNLGIAWKSVHEGDAHSNQLLRCLLSQVVARGLRAQALRYRILLAKLQFLGIQTWVQGPKECRNRSVSILRLGFVNICLIGHLDVHATETLLLTRLALLPKPGADFRPLRIGGALYRLIEVTVNKKYESTVSKKWRPNQFSVGVRDYGAILPALAQAMFNRGRTTSCLWM